MDIIKELDPLSNFMIALKAPDTKRQWPRRLKIVFDYLNLDGALAEQARQFVMIARKNPRWVIDSMMRFL